MMQAMLGRIWGRPARARRREPKPTERQGTVPRSAIDIPAPPEALAPHIIYPRAAGRTFAEVARHLGLLTSEQAQALGERIAEGGGFMEHHAQELGLSAEQVQEALAAQGFEIYVDARHFGSPRFMSWEARLRRFGIAPVVRKVSAQELATLRLQRGTGKSDDSDLETLSSARRLFADSAALGASDIHVFVREHHTEIQLRLKGDLRVVNALSMRREEGERFIRAIYSGLATVKDATYNPMEFQDAQIAGEALPGTGISSVRIIRGPCYPIKGGGSFLIARLQYREHVGIDEAEGAAAAAAAARRLNLQTPKSPTGDFKLGAMGYTPLQVILVSQLLRRPMGVIIVTGPTGSGKTTTLFECTRHQARLYPTKRLVTIENPTEYPMEWAIQLTTESERFPEMLRMTLRMDPDSVLLSEIRGAEEAIATIQAAATGHQVLTTLHVTDPFETFPRLWMLDSERLAPGIICNHSTVVGLIAQRIVPLLCQECSVPLEAAEDRIPQDMLKAMRSWGSLEKVRIRGAGCECCREEGIIGQQAVAEVVVSSEELMQDFINHGVAAARRNHRQRAGSDKPMIAHAMDLVLAGKLDPMDAERNVDAIPMQEDAA